VDGEGAVDGADGGTMAADRVVMAGGEGEDMVEMFLTFFL
jgi:hypothetical protein